MSLTTETASEKDFPVELSAGSANASGSLENASSVEGVSSWTAGLPTCNKCDESFPSSFLWDYFSYPVCSSCRDKDEEDLITRTQAKEEYLLKDCDLDIREPVLPFYRKKNPHNPRGHDMKLYLHLQVKKRALEIWGTFENLEVELAKRMESRLKSRGQKFEKRLKDLRRTVRSSTKFEAKVHEHDFANEEYDAKSETFFKICKTCNQKVTYEKM